MLSSKFGDGQFMFALKTNWQWDFRYIVYKYEKKINLHLIMLINVQNQFHSVSQILNRNNKNEIKFLICHK